MIPGVIARGSCEPWRVEFEHACNLFLWPIGRVRRPLRPSPGRGPIVATKVGARLGQGDAARGADEERLTQPVLNRLPPRGLNRRRTHIQRGCGGGKTAPFCYGQYHRGSGRADRGSIHASYPNGYVDLNHLVGGVGFAHVVALQPRPNRIRRSSYDAKTWFITGASSGLGRAFVEHALAQAIALRPTARNVAALQELAASAPERVLALALDDAARRTWTLASGGSVALQPIDVLINNAGYGVVGRSRNFGHELRTLMDTNFLRCDERHPRALPTPACTAGGAIVNISSLGGQLSFAGFSAYSATKFAMGRRQRGARAGTGAVRPQGADRRAWPVPTPVASLAPAFRHLCRMIGA